MVLIQNWLNSKQNFLVGRALYNQYGKDEQLKALFAKGEGTPGAKAALLQALRNLVTEEAVPANAAPTVTPEPVAEPHQEPALVKPQPGKPEFSRMPESEDPILKSLQLNWKGKYQQMQYLRAQLDNYGTDNSLETKATCNEICRQILFIEKAIVELWKQVDYYKEHGKLEDAKESVAFVVPKEPVDLAKKIASVQRYVRRHKRNAAKHPDAAKYPALIKKYEIALELLLKKQ